MQPHKTLASASWPEGGKAPSPSQALGSGADWTVALRVKDTIAAKERTDEEPD